MVFRFQELGFRCDCEDSGDKGGETPFAAKHANGSYANKAETSTCAMHVCFS